MAGIVYPQPTPGPFRGKAISGSEFVRSRHNPPTVVRVYEHACAGMGIGLEDALIWTETL